MKKMISALLLLGCSQNIFAKNLCTLFADAETGQLIQQQGLACEQRITPASTFKIAISLMGYDAKVLKTVNQPVLEYQTHYADWGGAQWKGQIDPAAWMKYSVFWYSQQVVEQLGQNKFNHYVQQFKYGNQDVTAIPVKDAGQQAVWVVSSLQISALEQLQFIRQVANREFPLSPYAYEMTERLIQNEVKRDGWTIYAKTGTGSPGVDGYYDASQAYGWYVGWAEKNGKKIIFVQLDQDEYTQKPNAGLRVRDDLLQHLPEVLKNIKP